MSQQEPYFMKFPEWWYYDENEGIIKLRDGAPEKIVKSYNEF